MNIVGLFINFDTKSHNMKKLILLTFLTFLFFQSFSQTDNKVKERKNTIRWNITPLIFDANNLTLGYERVLKNNQSFSVNAGFFLLPKLFKERTNIYFVEKTNRLGFTTAADYRFYLKKYNKLPAPAGVYIGPYFAHYRYNFDNTLKVNQDGDLQSSLDIEAGFYMTSVGFELGYQFVFWERLSLDLILIGPSISFYKGDVKASGDIEIDEDSDAYEYIHDVLLDKYPWLETFVDLGAINTGGKFDATSVGFRYVIQIGYRF